MSEKVHADNAAKQKAYRERLQARRKASSAGYSDGELARAARDLHIALWQAKNEGDERAARLYGETPLDTLRNVQAAVAPAQKEQT